MTPSDLIDVAIGKPAAQSSFFVASEWSGPGAAVSAGASRDYGFHTALEDAPWWQVDLLCTYPIQQIVLHNRLTHLQERTRRVRVELSRDGQDWTLVHAGRVPFWGGHSDAPFQLQLGGGSVRARFVRLSLAERQYFYLSRVEVRVAWDDVAAAENDADAPLAHSQPQPDALRVAILGTSNSIMRGYVPALDSQQVRVVANVSVGSSHATVVPFRLGALDAVDCDVLILDLAVNEQWALNKGLPNGKLVGPILDHVRAWCHWKKVVPVVLILPVRSCFQDEAARHAGAVREHFIALCRGKGIPFFDGYAFARRLGASWARDVRSLFGDPAHLTILSARLLGAALREQLPRLMSGGQLAAEQQRYQPFEYVPVAPLAPKQAVMPRATSLVSVEFVRLVEGDTLRVTVPQSSEVVGVVFNMSQTYGALRIEGTTRRIKALDNYLFDPARPIWLAVFSLLEPVAAGRGVVMLSCVDGAAVADCETHELRRPDVIRIQPVIELAGLVIRLPARQAPLARLTGVNLDLQGGARG